MSEETESYSAVVENLATTVANSIPADEVEIPRRSKYWRMKLDWAFEIGDVRITLVESRRGRASLRIEAPDSMRFKAFPLPPAPEIAASEPVEAPTPSVRVPLSEMDFGEWRRLTRGAA